MPFVQKPLRYAHSEGTTNVCYSDDGKYIVTCGSEGDVRVWKGFEDEEPFDKCVGDSAYAVVVKGNRMYVGTGNNYVQAFTFPEPELDGVVTRFKAPVTSIDVSSDGQFIACGSQDMEIHVKKDERVSVLTHHKAPILCVAVDPKGEYLASSSCDGTVQICKLNDGNEVIQTWNCIPKSNSVETSPVLCKISWTPVSGRFLAVPCQTEIVLYVRNSWQRAFSFTDSSLGQNEFFSVCSFSHCEQYLAVGTAQNKLFVWNVKNEHLESILELSSAAVCDIAWQPGSTNSCQFSFSNNEGYLGHVHYDKTTNSELSTSKVLDQVEQDDVSATSHQNGSGVHIVVGNEDGLNYEDFMDDDDDNENAVSVEKIKAQLGFNPDGSFTAGRVKEDGGTSRSVSRASSRASSPCPVIPQLEMQPPFQPSSTPSSLQFRFMVWNDVGIVEQTNTDDDQAISLKFHDSTFHFPFRIANEFSYSMAALSTDAVVFASEKTEEKSSHLGCTPLNRGQEWFTQLPDDEEALAVTVGIGWLAVATDSNLLRFFTIGGNQREVISLPGPVVCLSGWKNLLAAVYHNAPGVGGQQWLGYMIVEINPEGTCNCIGLSQPLPLTPSSTLKWMGFSDYGALCTTDSMGCVRLMSRTQTWHPICHTQKHVKAKSDNYFIIGVNECLQTIKVILCKGSEYPALIPTPYMTELTWKLPLCGMIEDKGRLEETLWRTKLASECIGKKPFDSENTVPYKAQCKNTVDINTTLIKLFSLACAGNLTLRAIEACKLSGSQMVMERAMKYAHMQNKAILAEQIAELITEKSHEEHDMSDVYDDSSVRMNTSEFLGNGSCGRPTPTLTRKLYNQSRSSANNSHSEQDRHDNISQDMFAETQDSSTNSNETLFGESSKSKLSPYTGLVSLSKENGSGVRKTGLNPFKKVANQSGNSNKGLASLSVPEPSKPTKSLSERLKPKAKVQKEKIKPVVEPSTPKTAMPPFKEWFNDEKENFSKEFPDLSASEITKLALKKYKSLKNATPGRPGESSASESPFPSVSVQNGKDNADSSPSLNEESALAAPVNVEMASMETPPTDRKRKQMGDPHEATPYPKKGTANTAASKLTGFFHRK